MIFQVAIHANSCAITRTAITRTAPNRTCARTPSPGDADGGVSVSRGGGCGGGGGGGGIAFASTAFLSRRRAALTSAADGIGSATRRVVEGLGYGKRRYHARLHRVAVLSPAVGHICGIERNPQALGAARHRSVRRHT